MSENHFNCKTKYSIFAVIVHSGKSIRAGHFISFIKRENKWYFCDDELVKETTESKITVENSYLLFYRQEK